MYADLMFKFIMAHKPSIIAISFYCLLFHERGKQNFMYRAKQYSSNRWIYMYIQTRDVFTLVLYQYKFLSYYVQLMRMYGSQWGSLAAAFSFIKSRIFYCKSCENLYQVLQVMCAASEHAMESKIHMIKSLSP